MKVEALTSVKDLSDAVDPVGALCSAGVDIVRVHCRASFANSGYNELNLGFLCMLLPQRIRLTASNIVVCVVCNPYSIGNFGPSLAAGGNEECGRK